MKGSKQFIFSTADITPFIIWVLVVFATWTFMHGAEHYLQLTPEAMGKYYNYKWFLIAHITAGGGTLILGMVQFWKKLRTYSWKLHRIIGFLYLLAVLTSGFSAVVLSFTTAYEVNMPFAFSLQIWVSVWLSSSKLAYYYATRKQFKLHEEWMTRSYIVTMAFLVSGLILKIPYVQSLGGFGDIASSFNWFGWSVPLYIYEIIRSCKYFK